MVTTQTQRRCGLQNIHPWTHIRSYYSTSATGMSAQRVYLTSCHDSTTGGHQGWHKTLHKLRMEAYWVNMAQDADQHCRECNICQRTKPTAPKRAPLINIPVGRPWQMVAVDILEVPVSSNNILVVQDYFTKWADARPFPDQTAVRITRELV